MLDLAADKSAASDFFQMVSIKRNHFGTGAPAATEPAAMKPRSDEAPQR